MPLAFLILIAFITPWMLAENTFKDVGPIPTAFGLVFFAFLCAVATFIAYFNDTIHDYVALIVIFLAGLLIVLTFAQIYAKFGLETPPGKEIKTFSTYIYFSIVTFTTLGYGDYQPKECVQLLAALQAVMGYIYLGFIVGSVHHMLSKLEARTASRT